MIVAALGAVLVVDPHASNANLLLGVCSCFHLSSVWMIAAAPSGADMGGAITHGSVGVVFAYLSRCYPPPQSRGSGEQAQLTFWGEPLARTMNDAPAWVPYVIRSRRMAHIADGIG